MEKKLKGSLKIGNLFFLFGLFLLPSAFSIAIFALLVSIFFSFSNNNFDKKNENINNIFYIACIFLTLSSTINFLENIQTSGITEKSFLIFIDLLNWIPLILLFQGSQKYLYSKKDRRNCIIALILGSIPVIFSCISQALLNWEGPFKTFFGLIVWYQRPIDGITGITGLFSNPNYLGAWLNIIWPFCLAFLYFDNKKIIKVIAKIFLVVSISTLIILTASRGAWICLLITLPFLFRSQIKKWLLPILSGLLLLILNLTFPIFGIEFQNLLRKIIPEGIWINFTSAEFETLDISRIGIWKICLNFIIDKPFFGHGSNSFPKLFFAETGFWKGHSHNLPIELFINYGIPTTLLILIPASYLIYKSYKLIFLSIKNINKETIIDRAWIISLFLLVLIHLIDIPYFDGRVSITGWILLAGARNIILINNDPKNQKLNFQIKY